MHSVISIIFPSNVHARFHVQIQYLPGDAGAFVYKLYAPKTSFLIYLVVVCVVFAVV